MKQLRFILIAFLATIFMFSCDKKKGYIDLNTGKTVVLVKDANTGYMVNADTKEPVDIYVDMSTKDTIYGRTGKVINNSVVLSEDGKYKYEDGDLKIKTDDDGASKVKDDDYKKKTDDDGDVKIKDGNTETKIDDGKVKVKTDD